MRQQTRQTWGTLQNLSDGSPTDYGLGIVVNGEGKNWKLSHNGSRTEGRARLVIWPNRQRGIVMMCNVQDTNPGQITTAIATALGW